MVLHPWIRTYIPASKKALVCVFKLPLSSHYNCITSEFISLLIWVRKSKDTRSTIVHRVFRYSENPLCMDIWVRTNLQAVSWLFWRLSKFCNSDYSVSCNESISMFDHIFIQISSWPVTVEPVNKIRFIFLSGTTINPNPTKLLGLLTSSTAFSISFPC